MGQGTLSFNTSGTVTIKFTWVRSDPNDKPPAKVYVQLSGSASWTGAGPTTCNFTGHCDNGLGSPEQPTYNTNKLFGGLSYGVKTYIRQSPQDYDRDAADPIQITNIPPISMSSILTATCPMGSSFSAFGRCTLTGQVLDPHPHPVNFRKVGA
jgi:hypothetical protein